MYHKDKIVTRRLSFGKKAALTGSLSGRGGGEASLKAQNHGVSSAISFVTSALGLLAQESLEIIEDADEIEEDELDHINLCEQSPTASPIIEDQFSPVPVVIPSDEPPSPTSHHAPFKH